MATYNQTNTVLNSLMSQYRGSTALTSTSLKDLISLGRSSISSSDFKEAYTNSLADVIGKTVFRYLQSSLEFPELYRDEFEFGGILRKIRIRPNQMKENASVKIGEQGFTPDPFGINKPNFGEKFFTDFDSWSDEITVPDKLLNTSFHDGSEAGSFIQALMDSVGNNFTAHQNLSNKTALINWIGEKIYNNNGVVNLRTMYNTQFSKSLTMAQCLTDQDFLQYAGMIIRNLVNYLKADNAIYNVGHEVNATPDEDLLLYFITDFVSAYETYLLNGKSIFTTEFIKLPNYREINTWQAGGSAQYTMPTFASNTAVKITTSSNHGIDTSGVIGIIADRNGIATTANDIYVATDRYNGARYTNYTYGAVAQYINDLDEQGIVLTIADDPQQQQSNNKSK